MVYCSQRQNFGKLRAVSRNSLMTHDSCWIPQGRCGSRPDPIHKFQSHYNTLEYPPTQYRVLPSRPFRRSGPVCMRKKTCRRCNFGEFTCPRYVSHLTGWQAATASVRLSVRSTVSVMSTNLTSADPLPPCLSSVPVSTSHLRQWPVCLTGFGDNGERGHTFRDPRVPSLRETWWFLYPRGWESNGPV